MRSCGHRHGHPIAGDGARRRPTACGDHCCSSGRVVTGSCRCVPPQRPPLRPVGRHGSRHCCPQLLCLELDGQPPWIPQLEGHVNQPSSHAAAARRFHGSSYTKMEFRQVLIYLAYTADPCTWRRTDNRSFMLRSTPLRYITGGDIFLSLYVVTSLLPA